MNGVWVWIEQRRGEMTAGSREAMSAGRNIAETIGEPLTAVVLGHNVAAVAEEAFGLGADAVWGADDATLADFRVEAYGPLFAEQARQRQPKVILTTASINGRDLACWVAAELEAGLTGDAISLAVDGQSVKVTRPVFAGKLLADVQISSGPQIITLRGRAFPAAEPTGKSGVAEWVSPKLTEDAIPSKVVGLESSEGQVSLTDARIIVSGGRGVGGPEGFAPVAELAQVLGGALGASRATVDANWIPYEHQVGQTGKTVSPDLYIACGISGAIQHQAGMRTSKVIVAINKDPEAPIFKLANYGIVGDLFKVLPALTAEFRRRLGK
jgi:electron transfer flavoprotein alpha subunit